MVGRRATAVAGVQPRDCEPVTKRFEGGAQRRHREASPRAPGAPRCRNPDWNKGGAEAGEAHRQILSADVRRIVDESYAIQKAVRELFTRGIRARDHPDGV